MTTDSETLADVIAEAESARDRADKAIHKFARSGRIDGNALSLVNNSMAALRVHLAEVKRLTMT